MDYGDKPAAAKWSLFTPPRWPIIAPPLTFAAKPAARGIVVAATFLC